jgi:hypothetical protein
MLDLLWEINHKNRSYLSMFDFYSYLTEHEQSKNTSDGDG